MSLFSFKNLKKSSVYITPNFPTLETKRYKFRILQLINYFILLLILLILLLSIAFTFTPLNNLIMFLENDKLAQQSERIEVLEKKLIILTSELNRISTLDKRLNYALTLARTDSLDSTAAIYDSLRKSKGNRIPVEGSILLIFEKLLNNTFSDSVFFINPIDGIIGKKYNPEKGHLGIDYSVSEGTLVLAPANGTIIFANYTTDNGNVLIIQHKENYLSMFKHCSVLLKSVRENVVQGEPIALSGNTGTNTSGPHLHFEIWKNSKPINPNGLLIN
ncbi:MAG: M23 family metallopeptidase [Melioribacteraceae bacterium]|nr:M23 family metallopeptidase [Melioribacteraceae bacterium]